MTLPWKHVARYIVAHRLLHTEIPIVVDGKINPHLVDTGGRGYWIQSQVLRIPDQYGFFVSGPPLLQAQEAHIFTISFTDAVCPVISIMMMELLDLFDMGWRLPGSTAAAVFCYLIATYVREVFFNPRRLHASEYDWDALGEKMGLVRPLA